MARVRVCGTLELPIFGGRLFEDVGNTSRDIMVFKVRTNQLRAWDAQCPHAGARLSPMHEMGGEIVCFLHQWTFDVDTGACKTAPGCDLIAYPIEVAGDDVWVTLPDP